MGCVSTLVKFTPYIVSYVCTCKRNVVYKDNSSSIFIFFFSTCGENNHYLFTFSDTLSNRLSILFKYTFFIFSISIKYYIFIHSLSFLYSETKHMKKKVCWYWLFIHVESYSSSHVAFRNAIALILETIEIQFISFHANNFIYIYKIYESKFYTFIKENHSI